MYTRISYIYIYVLIYIYTHVYRKRKHEMCRCKCTEDSSRIKSKEVSSDSMSSGTVSGLAVTESQMGSLMDIRSRQVSQSSNSGVSSKAATVSKTATSAIGGDGDTNKNVCQSTWIEFSVALWRWR